MSIKNHGGHILQDTSAPKTPARKAPGTGAQGWYHLDLSAIVYPTLQRKNFSSVYRLSVLLKEPIRPEILQQAVDIAREVFGG